MGQIEPIIQEVESEGVFYTPSIPKLSETRSEGIHLSHIIRDLYYTRMKRYGDQDIGNAAAIIEAGYTWEELLEQAWAFRQFKRTALLEGVRRPGEQIYDGIYMTPDGYHKGENVVHEYKLTTKSASKLMVFDTEFINFIWQVAGYCLALGSTKAVFWIMHIGRAQLYKEDIWKPARVYRVTYEFAPGELEMHWNTLMNHKDWMISEGLLSHG